jgi:hypothetical protein
MAYNRQTALNLYCIAYFSASQKTETESVFCIKITKLENIYIVLI